MTLQSSPALRRVAWAFLMKATAVSAACPDATTTFRGYSLTRSDGVVEQVLPQPDGSVVSLTDVGGILTESVRFEGLLLLRVTAVAKNSANSTTVYEYLGPEFLKLFPLQSGANFTLAQRVTQNGKPLERKFEVSVREPLSNAVLRSSGSLKRAILS
jgi:hypothetical protein